MIFDSYKKIDRITLNDKFNILHYVKLFIIFAQEELHKFNLN
jgi:hypothetical protein